MPSQQTFGKKKANKLGELPINWICEKYHLPTWGYNPTSGVGWRLEKVNLPRQVCVSQHSCILYVMLGRATLKLNRVIASTFQQKMKVQTAYDIREVR